MLLDQLKQSSQNSVAVCFLGVGDAFSNRESETSLLVSKNNTTLLIDAGAKIPRVLHRKQIELTDIDYFYCTHSHADHIGGLERILLSHRYIYHKKLNIIIDEQYSEDLWEHSLKGGLGKTEDSVLVFTDFAKLIRPVCISSDYRRLSSITIDGLELLIFQTNHDGSSFWSSGVLIDQKILFTSDTKFDPSIFADLPMKNVQLIFHDVQLTEEATVHPSYENLKTLDIGIKSKMHLCHYGDCTSDIDPQKDGFKGFVKPFQIYTTH
jgi:ribonuclease BN (tRNA processing enzyme)